MVGFCSKIFSKLSLLRRARIEQFTMISMIVSVMLISFDTEARRMGSGRNLGRQSSSIIYRQSIPPIQPSPPMRQFRQTASTQSGAAQTKSTLNNTTISNRSRWFGAIAGLAAGFGIAALLSHLGWSEIFTNIMVSIIVIGLVTMVVIWLIRKFIRRKHNANDGISYAVTNSIPATFKSSAFGSSNYAPKMRFSTPPSSSSTISGYLSVPTIPADFDTEVFLRNAKIHFVQLQAAWDIGNMENIRKFVTLRMLTEVKVDLDSRGLQSNRTDVVQLNAELLGVEKHGEESCASVYFFGLIREAATEPAEPFSEVWNLTKSARSGEGWLLAGIQQQVSH